MTCHVELHAHMTNPVTIDARKKDHFGPECRPGDIVSVRTDNCAAPIQNKFAFIRGKMGGKLEIARQVRTAHYCSCRNDKAAAFVRIMPAGYLIHFIDRRPERDMDIFASEMQRLANERHPVLPTNQASDTADWRFHNSQS